MTLDPGVWGVLATPLTADGSAVDTESLARQVRHYESIGATGLTVLGVFGEAARLTPAERRTVVETVVASSSRLPLVIGISALELDEVCAEAAERPAGGRISPRRTDGSSELQRSRCAEQPSERRCRAHRMSARRPGLPGDHRHPDRHRRPGRRRTQCAVRRRGEVRVVPEPARGRRVGGRTRRTDLRRPRRYLPARRAGRRRGRRDDRLLRPGRPARVRGGVPGRRFRRGA